jgi:hypothetical protein
MCEDTDHWWALANAPMVLRVSYKAMNLLAYCASNNVSWELD